jgi:hypothetical protein
MFDLESLDLLDTVELLAKLASPTTGGGTLRSSAFRSRSMSLLKESRNLLKANPTVAVNHRYMQF